MKYCVAALCLASLLGAAAGANTPQAARSGESLKLMAERASALYGQGRYGETARLYQDYSRAGGDGAEVHYDLGNCLLKSGDLGRAILEYRRALRYDPNLAPAIQNLVAARSLLPAKKAPWKPPPWESVLQRIPRPAVEWAAILSAFLACACYCACLFISPGRGRRALAGASVGFLCATAVSGAMTYYSVSVLPRHQGAVILADAPAHARPSEASEPVGSLPAGSEVVQVAEAGDWRLLRWGEGMGWVASSKVGIP